MKIYQVTFNDGVWHSGDLPKFMVVAESKEEAIKDALKKHPSYTDWDNWAAEFKIDGYVIEVYDEKSYKRDKNLEKLI